MANTIFTCEKCLKILKHKQSLVKHLSSSCKVVLKERSEVLERQREADKCKEKKELLSKVLLLSDQLKDKDKIHAQEIAVLKKEMDDMHSHYHELRVRVGVYSQENVLLRSQNATHLEKLYKLAETPSVINQHNVTTKSDSKNIQNIIHLQPFDLSDEKTKTIIHDLLANISNEQFEHYLKGGQKGVAKAVYDAVLTKDGVINTSYHTSDASRHIFEFKSNDGQIVKDNKAYKLSKILHDGIINRTLEVTRKQLNETKDVYLTTLINERLVDIRILPQENNKFCTELARIM
jgi:hypothetical protein